MNKIRIEILEEGGIKEGVIPREKGDIYNANEDIAKAYISAGLAKNVETGEVGERITGVSKVNVKNIKIQTTVA